MEMFIDVSLSLDHTMKIFPVKYYLGGLIKKGRLHTQACLKAGTDKYVSKLTERLFTLSSLPIYFKGTNYEEICKY